ncbi:unnamed protein product [Caenorhabditis auriculariae]|uniref:Apyrase n=1 Tax=Caenorhabditis auriculariae TaxID=2777116 RepID=A0A8S1H0W8_9PELO|nr:unnamed protein product [Caenorhabditis auriculariae]
MGKEEVSKQRVVQKKTPLFEIIVVVVLSSLSLFAYHLGTLNTQCAYPHEVSNKTQLYVKHELEDGSVEYSITMVTDLDHDSKEANGKSWRSLVSRGWLQLSPDRKAGNIRFDAHAEYYVNSQIAAGGRSMELSCLAVFNGSLYTVDDRTGLIYWLRDRKAVPWVIVNDGPGNVVKGLKGEWMTMKDDRLIVGGIGKEWTTTEGEYVNDYPMWIKKITPAGSVQSVNWKDVYIRVRRAVGIEYPGYMIHEAVQWSEIHKKWFFLPRRLSTEKYSEAEDEERGTNVMIIGNEELTSFDVVHVGNVEQKRRGFSAFQFVPDTKDNLILAIKSEEKDGKPVGSFATVFDVHGNIIMSDFALHGAYKYEGLAFA